jgi:heptosyltransferase III
LLGSDLLGSDLLGSDLLGSDLIEEPKTIAIFRLGHLGDTIVAMPAFWTVRKRFPAARILYLTQEHQAGKRVQSSDVLPNGIVFDEVVRYTLGTGGVSKLQILQTLLTLRRQRIDMLVYLPPYRTPAQLDRDAKFFRLAGIKRIVGMQGYRDTNYRPSGSPLPTVRREVDILLSHLAKDGIQIGEQPSKLRHLGLSNAERDFARQWLCERGIDVSRPIVGMGPGSKMLSKLWPMERFVEVAQGLDRSWSPTFIVFGGPAERVVCQTVCDGVTRAHNVAGELTVRQSAAIFEHCHLYLGNDTGTMHIAAAAGVRCVALFSARDWPGRWFPYGEGHVVHRVVVPCEGCMLETCDKDNLCLQKIEVAPVLASAEQILAARFS